MSDPRRYGYSSTNSGRGHQRHPSSSGSYPTQPYNNSLSAAGMSGSWDYTTSNPTAYSSPNMSPGNMNPTVPSHRASQRPHSSSHYPYPPSHPNNSSLPNQYGFMNSASPVSPDSAFYGNHNSNSQMAYNAASANSSAGWSNTQYPMTSAHNNQPTSQWPSTSQSQNQPFSPQEWDNMLLAALANPDPSQFTPSPASGNSYPSYSALPVDRGKQCYHCRATSTPLWRRDPVSHNTLCNACGLYLQQHNSMRPQKLIEADNDEEEEESSGITPDGPQCSNCYTRTTSVWRRSKEGDQVCNACGVYARLNDKPRPLSLKKNKIRPRARHPTTGS
ncbi:hypothetical protein C8J57DRAFT_1357604 [Mycena rebaudengoi]|nr:hypothetical protein C8J57DRAFT_1357604 [Mycena rebaudengoi]